MKNFKSFITEETEIESYNTKPIKTMLHTVEKPEPYGALLNLHIAASANGIRLPDMPMKYGDIYHHGTLAHQDVFFTEPEKMTRTTNSNYTSLPDHVKDKLYNVEKTGRTHKLVHMYNEWGGVTYAHNIPSKETHGGRLNKYEHQDNYYDYD